MAFNDVQAPEALPQGTPDESLSNIQDPESTVTGGPTDPGHGGSGRSPGAAELNCGVKQGMDTDVREDVNAEGKKDEVESDNATAIASTGDGKTSTTSTDSKLKSTLSSFGIDPENEKVKNLLSKVTGSSGMGNATTSMSGDGCCGTGGGDDAVGVGSISRLGEIGGSGIRDRNATITADASYEKETSGPNMGAAAAARDGLMPSSFCGGDGGMKTYKKDKGFGVSSGLGENYDVRGKNEVGVGGVGSGEVGVPVVASGLMGGRQEGMDRGEGQVGLGTGLGDGDEGENVGGGVLGERRNDKGE